MGLLARFAWIVVDCMHWICCFLRFCWLLVVDFLAVVLYGYVLGDCHYLVVCLFDWICLVFCLLVALLLGIAVVVLVILGFFARYLGW